MRKKEIMGTSKKSRMFALACLILLITISTLAGSIWAESHSYTQTLHINSYMDVGIITVWHDDTAVYVEYNSINAQELDIPDGWEIAETHLAIGGIRQAKLDDPIPGQFPFNEKHDPPVKKYAYIIDFNEWDVVPEDFYVAARAVLVPSEEIETEWSNDSEECTASLDWATYFNYTLTQIEDNDESELESTGEFPDSKPHRLVNFQHTRSELQRNAYYCWDRRMMAAALQW